MKTSIKTRYLISGLICFMLYNCQTFAQAIQTFRTIPRISIKQDEDVKIIYQPTDKISPVTGVVYLFKDYKWEGHDLPLTKTDTGYVASYHIPEGTSFMCYRFWLKDSVDVGGRYPYAHIVYDKSGKSAGNPEWGLIRFKQADGFMMPIVSKESEIEPNVLVGLWISKGFADVRIRRHMFYNMARGIKSYKNILRPDSGLLLMGNEILQQPDITEREMIAVERTYDRIMNKRAKADSVKSLILAKYPDGLRKRLLKLDSVRMIRNPEEASKKLQAFMQKYPFSEYSYDDYFDPEVSDPSFFYNSYTGVVSYLFMQKRLDEVKSMIKEGPYKLLNNDYIHFVDYSFRTPTPVITSQQQLDLSTFIINNLLQRSESKDKMESGRGYFSPLEWKKLVVMDNKFIIAFHANLLYKAGKYADALKFADMVRPYLKYSIIDFNTLYVHLLDHFHKNTAAQEYMETAIRTNTASPDLINLFKSYYIKKHKSDQGFDDYYTNLVPAKQIEELHERLKKSLIHVPAVAFNLKNMKGETVDLIQQKGKIVVLDFWASWCFPCKQAMPGMETLVQKYKPDNNVQFFFIATLEESANYKKWITDFINEKKYDFNVLYDENDPKTGKMGLAYNGYAKLLHMSGIPQKVIIDPNGYVRWVAEGFNGDLVQLTKEVDYVISLIKQEKSE
jgi:thiol-disulfide isomerase/thioredoxin